MRTETPAGMTELWTFPTVGAEQPDVVGFDVQTADGGIGKIDGATFEAGSSYIVVDASPWILGRRVVVPAGLIDRIDLDKRSLKLSAAREQIEKSPAFDPDAEDYRSDAYRECLGSYYADHFTARPRGKMVRIWFTSGRSGPEDDHQ